MTKVPRKRRDKIASLPTPTTQRRVAGSSEYRQAFCPCCGRSQGTLAFWQRTQNFDPNKPFGVIQEVGRGRGASFDKIGYFNPEDEPELFEAVKLSQLRALREWIDKKWIAIEDLEVYETRQVISTPVERKGNLRLLVESLEVIDESKKANSIKRIEKVLDEIDTEQIDNISTSVDELRSAIEEYKNIEKEGFAPEEYREEKESAFEAITEAADNIKEAAEVLC